MIRPDGTQVAPNRFNGGPGFDSGAFGKVFGIILTQPGA